MTSKTKIIVALNIFLVIVLAIKPELVNDMYSSILGRLVLLGTVIFFSMNNFTLGLLVALVIISGLNQYGSFVEGMDNIGDDVSGEKGTKEIITASKEKKLSELKEENAEGIDKEDIKNAIMSKDSKTIPVDKSMTSSDEVSAHTPSMITNSSSLTEGFCPCASSLY